ncbi:hypothetical protein [Halocalculus aciditolerans]|uniref:ABC-2 type transport system permease protein n=1 Tax=Halocalculus aciditolerans TaxID=1383812 RepID=A0A830FKU1_9EURY|nr:hypothetical protein [Halocalculus aciditolerans]GGL56309.1 hypothetical protein GCM10009039_13030 [Halocalculus aciditolerans]
MRGFPNPSHALAIGRFETVRRFRVVTGSALQLVALAVGALFLVGVAFGAAAGAYVVGGQLAAGAVSNAATYATWTASGIVLGLGGLTGFRIVGEQGEIDHEAGMLTTVPYRDVVGGILVAELVGVAVYLTPLALLVGGGLAVGSGSLLAGVCVPLAVGVLAVFAVTAGHAVGYVLRAGIARSPFFAAHKSKLAVGVFLAYMYFVTVYQDFSVFRPLLDAVGGTPVGWVGLAPLAALGTASPLLAVAGFAAVAAVTPVCLRAAVAAAGDAWYTETVASTRASGEHEETSVAGGRLASAVGGPSAWVARIALTRAYRRPIKVVFVLYPSFALVTPLADIAQTGEVPGALPVVIAVYGAWAAGAGFALNPLGDDGAMLPVTLTSGLSGRAYVRGLVTAAVLAGAGVVLPAALVLGVLVPLTPTQLLTLAAATLALLVGGSMLATGVGCAFPRFDAVRISRSRRVVAPSLIAFAVYSLVLFIVSLPGLATQSTLVASGIGNAVGLSAESVQVFGALVTAGFVGVAGYVSYRSAVDAVDSYTL